MQDPHQYFSGTQNTPRLALTIGAFLLTPAIMMTSRSLGFASLGVTIAVSGVLLLLAQVACKHTSRLTIPSLAVSPLEHE